MLLRESKTASRSRAPSVSAFGQMFTGVVVKQPRLWVTTGVVPVAGGEAVTRWGRIQTSGTKPPATGSLEISIRKRGR